MDNLVIVIIDDEPNNRELLKRYIELLYPLSNHTFHLCNSVKAGVEIIKSNPIDLVFLDIVMPEQDGFELFKHVNHYKFEVVFTTAYQQYMQRSINDFQCFGYLTKPIIKDDLKNIFNRFYDKINNTKKYRLISHNNNKRELINLDDIIYCKGEGSYCAIYTSEDKYVQSKTLGEVEQVLPSDNFMRVHKSFVVNLNHVKNYSREFKQLQLKISCVEEQNLIPVSKSYKDKIESLNLLKSSSKLVDKV
ncbi:LytR/AlgR family response regulator transcription factor [Myroides sp. LJL119]